MGLAQNIRQVQVLSLDISRLHLYTLNMHLHCVVDCTPSRTQSKYCIFVKLECNTFPVSRGMFNCKKNVLGPKLVVDNLFQKN